MNAVSIEEVKRHLRITDGDNDELLAQKLEAAAAHVYAYIGAEQDAAAIREAILQQTANFYDGTPVELGGLLAPFRSWAF